MTSVENKFNPHNFIFNVKHIGIEKKQKPKVRIILFNIFTRLRSLLIGLRFKLILQWHKILFPKYFWIKTSTVFKDIILHCNSAFH